MEKCEVCNAKSEVLRKGTYQQDYGDLPAGETRYKSMCPECQRYSNMFRTHGVTRIQYDFMLSSQDGKCAVCKEDGNRLYPDVVKGKGGTMRGLLCYECKDLVRCMDLDMRNTCRALVYLGQGES